MGGGDLNSKKSWHPNTMKNQERVWKAEQAAAEEKKRIVELQRERAEERDRTELNNLMTKRNSVSTGNESHLAWMYNKPDKNIQDEEYLLGKSIDRNAEQSQKVEQDAIPAVSRRVVGSSMLATGGDTQVDLARKVREDPLLLIKERERAARAALLNNPLQRRRLTELLRKEKDQKEEKKIKKKAKKKDKDVDKMLAAKLSALRGEKGLNLAALLDSNESFDSSSEDQSKKKKKKRKKEKVKKSKKLKKKKKHSSSSDSDGDIKKETEINKNKYKSSPHESSQGASESRKRRYFDTKDSDDIKTKRPSGVCHGKFNDEYVRERYNDKRNESKEHQFRRSSPRDNIKSVSERDSRRPVGLTEEEKAAKLAEMATAGAERELQRGRRVAEQRAADAAADKSLQSARGSMKNEARCLPDSLQSRIHSNRHYIQRDKRHMNEHFARR